MIRRVALLAFLAIAFGAQAADEANLREARALIDAMHMQRQLDAMSTVMSQGMSRQLADMGGSGDPRRAEIFMSEAMAVMKERALQPGGIIDAAIVAYAESFTLEELRQLRAFYESPTGQKMLERTPQVMARIMQTNVGISRQMYPEVCARAKARLEAEGLREEAAALKCAPPAAPAAPAKGNG